MDNLALAIFTAAVCLFGLILAIAMRPPANPARVMKALARLEPGLSINSDERGFVFDHAGRRSEVGFCGATRSHGYYTSLTLDLGDLPQIPIEITREDFFGKMDKALLRPELKVGIPSFDERFIVHSARPESARHFLTPETCAAIESLGSLAGRDALLNFDRPKLLIVRLSSWERDARRLKLILEASRTIFDGYLAAIELEPKPEPKKKLLEVLPDACVVCQGKLDGEPIRCRWCGALYHPGCQPESGICGACGSQMREANEG